MKISKLRKQIADRYFAGQLGIVNRIVWAMGDLEKTLVSHNLLPTRLYAFPHFLGIGATKAGTTWLYNNLKLHPQLFLPRTKELHFFDRRYRDSLITYSLRFSGSAGRIRGEITPAYAILDVERIQFIHKLIPKARLVYILRDPVERAWSEALHILLRKGNKRDFSEVPASEFEAVLKTNAIVDRSMYTDNIRRWQSVYPPQQILILFYDDLVNQPQSFLERVFQHIGVSTDVDWKQFPFWQRFNVNPRVPVPEHFREALRTQYRDEIERLHQMFGKQVESWRIK